MPATTTTARSLVTTLSPEAKALAQARAAHPSPAPPGPTPPPTDPARLDPLFPMLSGAGLTLAVVLLGLQWFLTRPSRRSRHTL